LRESTVLADRIQGQPLDETSNSQLEQIPDSVLLDPGLVLAPHGARPEPPPEVQLLCVRCWNVFQGWSKAACPKCSAERPAAGWATMPHTFRDRYLFWKLLGRGGMGAVFLAYDEHQTDEQKKTVAIKVVPQTSTPRAQMTLKRMFEREASAASMLAQSSHFVRVTSHDVGVEPAYLAMEYVDWPTLRQLLKRGQGKLRPLSPVKVARIGIAILRGLSTMHFHRIVHRDLKPDNIFVRRSDSEEYEIKILDLGVWTKDELSLAGASLPVSSREEASPVGTFSYMSPEQMASKPVGATSDIHTIGSVLWELATTRVPYPMRSKELIPGMHERMLRLEQSPEKPESMPDGLYEILVKALAFDPSDRWESAEEMKSALKVWVAEELLRTQAAVSEAVKRLRGLEKQVRALRSQIAPGAGLIEQLRQLGDRVSTLSAQAEEAPAGALARSVIELEGLHRRASEDIEHYVRELERALIEHGALQPTADLEPKEQKERKDRRARARGPKTMERLAVALLTFTITVGVVEILSLDPERGERLGRSSSEVRGKMASALGLSQQQRASVKKAVESAVSEAEASSVSEAPIPSEALAEAVLGSGHAAGYVGVAFSPAAPIVASGSADSSVRLWRTDDGRYLGKIVGAEGVVFETAFSPNGKELATAGEDGVIRVFDAESRRLVAELEGHRSVVRAVVFSPDGRTIASGGEDGSVRLWSLQTKREIRQIRTREKRKKTDAPVRALAFDTKGELLAIATNEGRIQLVNVANGSRTRSFMAHEGGTYGLAISNEGLIASSGFDHAIRLWTTRGELVRTLNGHEGQVRSVAFSPDGRTIVSAGFDRTVRVWTTDGAAVHVLRGHRAPVYQAAFSANGELIASGAHDKSVRIWKSDDGHLVREHLGREGLVLDVAIDRSGRILASAGHDATIRLVSAVSGELIGTLEGHKGWIQGLAFSPAGDHLASASHDKTIRIWSMLNHQSVRTLEGHTSWVRDVAFSPDGLTLASASEDRSVRIWDVATGSERLVLSGHAGDVRAVSFSADGKLIVSAGEDRTIRIWSADTGRANRTIANPTVSIRAIAISPDGSLIAAGGDDRVLRFFEANSGSLVRTAEGHAGSIRSIAFSADGDHVATASSDRTIKLWSVRGGTLERSLEGHELGVESVAFAANGQKLVSGGFDSTRRIWDWQSGSWTAAGMSAEGWVVFDDHGRIGTSR
jgi:WD40 repeat protein/serine/threonine protein kinase